MREEEYDVKGDVVTCLAHVTPSCSKILRAQLLLYAFVLLSEHHAGLVEYRQCPIVTCKQLQEVDTPSIVASWSQAGLEDSGKVGGGCHRVRSYPGHIKTSTRLSASPSFTYSFSARDVDPFSLYHHHDTPKSTIETCTTRPTPFDSSGRPHDAGHPALGDPTATRSRSKLCARTTTTTARRSRWAAGRILSRRVWRYEVPRHVAA